MKSYSFNHILTYVEKFVNYVLSFWIIIKGIIFVYPIRFINVKFPYHTGEIQ